MVTDPPSALGDDDPSRWEEDPCQDTPTAVVLLGIAAAVLGPLAAAFVLAM